MTKTKLGPTDKSLRRLHAAFAAADVARRKAETATEKTLYEGATVQWDRAGVEHRGRVVRVCGARLYVQNERTGREYWIGVHDVFRALGSEN